MSKIVEMNRLDSHPLAARFYDMSSTIETLGGSPELTDALTSLHALRQEVEDELNRLFTEVGWKKDRSHGIFVEESRELDSGDMMGFFARGHYEQYKFAEACNEYTGADPYYDRRYVHANDCRHEWWRTVPVSGEPGVVSYHNAEPHSRGAFAVTVTHVVEDRQRKQTQRWIDEHNKGRAAAFAEGLNWALHKLDRINPDAGEELLREYRERDNTQKSTKATPSPQTRAEPTPIIKVLEAMSTSSDIGEGESAMIAQAAGYIATLTAELSALRASAKEERERALEEAAKAAEGTAHEGLHGSMWEGKFKSLAASIRALMVKP